MLSKHAWISGSVVAVTALATISLTPAWADSTVHPQHSQKPPKNVILMVGDGMGAGHRQAIRLSKVGLKGELEMDNMPISGLVHTSSADPKETVTDSAAAATAMSTGVKTFNGAIGVDVDKKSITSVMEVAKKLGKATGLVTTSQVTDATPAAFGSHVADRKDQSEIARQLIENAQPDVILGGGEDYFYPVDNPGKYPDTKEQKSAGKTDLIKQAQKNGYKYVWNRKELKKTKDNKILGLFANEEMFKQAPEDEGAVYKPVVPLKNMTKKALSTLSRKSKKGFFLMVEEEGIDEMAHQNNAKLTMKSGKAFDKTVAVAKAYAKKHRNTLVIVVGDHETGGLTIENSGVEKYPDESGDGLSKEDGPFPVSHSDKTFMVDWTTGNHSGTDVPLTAMGPGSERLTGVYENTHIHDVILRTLQGR
ncbi:alkaline phosphatase [Marininema mesophilum]|uniref:Alkaline phosphatase n=1 Tax=Marininema mesophilum TaxID=1048340 RepID=A0A1H2YCZ9_9BACL|nr:alkaline phosphatase [Marininema mesophilum]SDX02845.1 alkaline phosphatase [Marininema mesophilum]